MTLSICQEGIKHLLKIARAFLTKPLAKLSLSLNKWRYLHSPNVLLHVLFLLPGQFP